MMQRWLLKSILESITVDLECILESIRSQDDNRHGAHEISLNQKYIMSRIAETEIC